MTIKLVPLKSGKQKLQGIKSKQKPNLTYLYPEDRIFNRVIWDISVVVRETTLTISDSTETVSPVKSQIVRVASLDTTEITEITRFKQPFFRVGYLEYRPYMSMGESNTVVSAYTMYRHLHQYCSHPSICIHDTELEKYMRLSLSYLSSVGDFSLTPSIC